MAIYSVHEPPLKRFEVGPDPERYVFVRDGFAFWAFLFGPLWMLRHRMWLVLLGYVVVVVGLQAGLHVLDAGSEATFAVGLLLALLIGIEASTLRRFTLRRRGWTPVGVVQGVNLEAAERRFFDGWTGGEVRPAAPAQRTPGAGSDVIGLFPEPGAPR